MSNEKKQPSPPPKPPAEACTDTWQSRFLGIMLIILTLILVFGVVEFWPTHVLVKDGQDNAVEQKEPQAGQAGGAQAEGSGTQSPTVATGQTGGVQAEGSGTQSTTLATGQAGEDTPEEEEVLTPHWSDKTLIFKWNVGFQLRMLIMVLLAGALGSAIHALNSFAVHQGKKDFTESWMWWYWKRIPTGAALALILILLVRGGIFSLPETDPAVNPFSTIGLAALAGLFSKNAMDKMAEIFETMFRISKDNYKKWYDKGGNEGGDGNAGDTPPPAEPEKPGESNPQEGEAGAK